MYAAEFAVRSVIQRQCLWKIDVAVAEGNRSRESPESLDNLRVHG